MKKRAAYWCEPVESLGMCKGTQWGLKYGWSTAHLSTIKKVRKMLTKYPDIHFRVEKVVCQKGNRWHYPIITLKMSGLKISKLPELWERDLKCE